MKDITKDFEDAIISFEADFNLETDYDELDYVDFRDLVKSKDEKLLEDIDTLSRLSYGIRHCTIKIVEV